MINLSTILDLGIGSISFAALSASSSKLFKIITPKSAAVYTIASFTAIGVVGVVALENTMAKINDISTGT